MTVRFLLDENVEHRVRHRLDKYGYDVEHVEFVAGLGKGSADTTIAEYSENHEAVIVTHDDDFLTDLEKSAFYGVVYFEDVTLTDAEIATVLHRMAENYTESAFRGREFGGREWL